MNLDALGRSHMIGGYCAGCRVEAREGQDVRDQAWMGLLLRTWPGWHSHHLLRHAESDSKY